MDAVDDVSGRLVTSSKSSNPKAKDDVHLKGGGVWWCVGQDDAIKVHLIVAPTVDRVPFPAGTIVLFRPYEARRRPFGTPMEFVNRLFYFHIGGASNAKPDP